MLLAESYKVSQNTTWLFRAKVRTYLASSQLKQLSEDVHIDGF